MKALQVVALALLLLAIGFLGGMLHGQDVWRYALSLRSYGEPPTTSESCSNPSRKATDPPVDYWVVFGDGAWRVRLERFGIPLGAFDTQEEAEAFALRLAGMTCPATITEQQLDGRRISRVIKVGAST